MAGRRDYDRYEMLKNSDGTIDSMPFIKIPKNASDKFEEWKVGNSRLEKLANRFYKNPFYDFLILYANPEYISQWDIPDGTVIRIPFPLAKVKKDYEDALKKYKKS